MKKRKLGIELLGDRIAPSASFVGGVLTVQGTDAAERLTVRQVGSAIRVDGQTINVAGKAAASVPSASVRSVVVIARGGNDNISVAGLSVAARVEGGSGNDSITGGKRDDSLYGGSGNDLLTGSTGNDHLRGEAGDDRLNGELGNDSLFGGVGNDWLGGGSQNDWLSGDTGDDSLDGGSGNDWCDGGSGRDRNTGGGGDDRIKDIDASRPTNAGIQTSIEGTITAINVSAKTITIRTKNSASMLLTITNATKVERNDNHTTLATFRVGDRAEAKFDSLGNLLKLEATSL